MAFIAWVIICLRYNTPSTYDDSMPRGIPAPKLQNVILWFCLIAMGYRFQITIVFFERIHTLGKNTTISNDFNCTENDVSVVYSHNIVCRPCG